MDEAHISRGFRSKRQGQAAKDRVPPGQYVTTDFPILSAGPTPQIKVSDWKLALQLGGSLFGKWSWEAVRSAAPDHDQDRHSLCHQMVEARYDLAGRHIRRSFESSRAF